MKMDDIQRRLKKELSNATRQTTDEDQQRFTAAREQNSQARLQATGVKQLTRSALHQLLNEHQDRWKNNDSSGCMVNFFTAGLAHMYYKWFWLNRKWAHPTPEDLDAAIEQLSQEGEVQIANVLEKIPDDVPENFDPKVIDTMVTLIEEQ